MSEFAPDSRSRVKRQVKRASYDKAVIYPIIDEARICHVAFVVDGQPFVIPTLHARIGDEIAFHGARTGRLMEALASGQPVCLSFTLLDGLVLARSVFHHSVNYRSAVVFGCGRPVVTDDEKLACLRSVTEHLTPGRWDDARQPDQAELNATAVAVVRIDSASAKVRSGPPVDAEEDLSLGVWAGVVSLSGGYGAPSTDLQGECVGFPAYLAEWIGSCPEG